MHNLVLDGTYDTAVIFFFRSRLSTVIYDTTMVYVHLYTTDVVTDAPQYLGGRASDGEVGGGAPALAPPCRRLACLH